MLLHRVLVTTAACAASFLRCLARLLNIAHNVRDETGQRHHHHLFVSIGFAFSTSNDRPTPPTFMANH